MFEFLARLKRQHVVFMMLFGFMLCPAACLANEDVWSKTLVYLEDPQRQFSLDQVLASNHSDWLSADQTMLNFGFSRSAYWIRFDVVAAGSGVPEYMLEIANPKITLLDVYLLSQEGSNYTVGRHWSSGMEVPVSQREYSHRHFVFPVVLPDHAHRTLLIRVENNYPLKLPLYWTSASAFHERDHLNAIFQGVYFGSILIMAFYNLFIFAVVRDRSYALYFVFMLVMSLFLAVDRGLAYQFLWPGRVHTDYVAYVALMSFAAAWSVFFSIEFLSLREYLPRFARGLKYLGSFWLVMTVLAIGLASPALVIFEVLIVVPAGGALIFAGILAWKKGVPAAPYYMIAWVVIIHGAVVYALTLVNLFPPGNYAEYALQVCSIAEAALLSLGLAHRIKTLDRERNMAYAAARAKTDFLATMSHEIRTPMNGMLGMAQLLQETGVTEQQQRYVSTILSSGQALLTLLNDTLDFSKIEARKLELECLEFDLRQLIDDSAAIFSLRAVEKRLRFFVGVEVGVPRCVTGDPTRVRQVLANLLSNAFKFTDQGAITLRVSASSGAGRILFEVQDSGIGMGAETIDKLFTPFSQASASTSRQYGGTGLGLSICKQLVEMMGGTIGVTSKEGNGTRFWFALPLAPAEGYSEPIHCQIRFRTLNVVSVDAETNQQLADYAAHLGLEYRRFSNLSALADGWPEPGSLVLMDTQGTQQWLSGLEYFGRSASGWLACQWGLLIKPGDKVTCIPGFAFVPWVYEMPFSISLFEQHLAEKKSVEASADVTAPLEKLPLTLGGKRVLVVDDNPINSLVACGFLGKMGIETQVAHSGLEALAMLEQASEEFDLVLMDCEMPGLNGYETTQAIRLREKAERRERRKIVALSAHSLAEHRQKCLDAGMDEMLTKPLMFAVLQLRVSALLA